MVAPSSGRDKEGGTLNPSPAFQAQASHNCRCQRAGITYPLAGSGDHRNSSVRRPRLLNSLRRIPNGKALAPELKQEATRLAGKSYLFAT